MKHVLTFAIWISLACFAQTEITLNNPNFDEDLLLEGGFATTLTGWSVTGSAGAFNPTETQYPSESGTRENVGFTNNGTLIQVTSELLAADMVYTLDLEVGHRNDTAQAPFTIRFVAAGLVLAQVGGYTIAAGDWRDVQLNLTTSPAHPIGSPLEIHLISANTQSNYDNVSLFRDGAVGGGGGGGTPGFINADTTLNVPAQYSDIQAALDSLDGVAISKAATVTIAVADGTYAGLDTILVDHPFGKHIEIVGNTANPSAVTLSFANEVDGFHIDSSNLGLLDGFTILGDNLLGIGIYAFDGSRVVLGSAVALSNFAQGVYATNNTSIYARNVQSNANGVEGFRAAYNSTIDCQGATAANNGGSNFVAIHNSVLHAQDVVAINGFRGLNAWMNSTIYGTGSTVTGNTVGLLSNDGCHIHMGGGNVSSNTTNYLPAANTVGQSNSYIYKF